VDLEDYTSGPVAISIYRNRSGEELGRREVHMAKVRINWDGRWIGALDFADAGISARDDLLRRRHLLT
jgi:hypothetical protein